MTSRLYNASVKRKLDLSDEPLDLVIIAVRDSNIIDIVSELVVPDYCLLIHTSGSQSMEILERSACPNIGVLYPLQTISKNDKVSFKDIPFYIEANTGIGLNILKKVSRDLSKHVFILDSQQRRTLHLSAVFASNFTNHMLMIAEEIMKKNKLDFKNLQWLVQKTIEKSFTIGPANGQTGPAIRRDHETMDLHTSLLSKREDLVDLYLMISNHIMRYAGNAK